MTYEKAVELARQAMVNSKSRPHGLVDALVCLQLLDFDKAHPDKSVARKNEMLTNALESRYGNGPYYIDQIFGALAFTNLELVERK